MARRDYTKTRFPDALFVLAFTALCAVLTFIFTEPQKQPEPLPPEDYNLLCKKNFDMPSKFNVVLECMHVRKDGG